MKYIITFLVTLFGTFILFSFPVFAYPYTVTQDETALDDTADEIINQYLTSDYSPYYVYYKFQYPSLGNNNGAFGFQKIYFQDNVTFVIPSNSGITLGSTTPTTSTIYANVINLRTGGYRIDGYSNSWLNSSASILDYGSQCNITIIENTVPVTYNDTTFDPPPDVQGDTFFVTKDGFTNNFGVYCGPASEYVEPSNDTDLVSGFYRTKQYTVHIKFQYQGSTIDFIIPNYLNWLYKYNVYIKSQENVSNILEMLQLFTWYAEPVYNSSMQAIRCPVINSPQLSNIMSFENMTDYRSFNQITLSQLLSALTPTYSNLTINDLYTVLTFEFYDSDGKKVYSAENDYSSLYNSGVEPTPDPYVTNLNNSTETLNQNITSNNKYLQDIIYGDVYEPFPYEQSIKDAGSVNLDLISVPDYTYEKHNIDSSASSFFGRMVEWWYLDSPFGLVAIVALTFLVIRVILW